MTEDHRSEDEAWERLVEAGQQTAAKRDAQKPVHRARNPARKFVQISMEWLERLKSARHIATYRMALFLAYQAWQTNYRPTSISNVALRDWGVSRWEKSKALQELENLGLIEVKRRGRRTPIVTLL
jgi:hypothetical protein